MYKRAIVPLDGSQLAEGIVSFILGIAGPLDLEVVLLRVVTPVIPHVVEGSRYVELDDLEARATEAREYLAPIAAELAVRGVRVRTEVRRGEPVSEILACARAVDADLIAMTTHGRSGLGRLLFGSVAEAVLRQADVPVFLMRQTRARARTVAAGDAR